MRRHTLQCMKGKEGGMKYTFHLRCLKTTLRIYALCTIIPWAGPFASRTVKLRTGTLKCNVQKYTDGEITRKECYRTLSSKVLFSISLKCPLFCSTNVNFYPLNPLKCPSPNVEFSNLTVAEGVTFPHKLRDMAIFFFKSDCHCFIYNLPYFYFP